MDARASNPDFSLSFFHKMFGSSKYVFFTFFFFGNCSINLKNISSSTLLTIFGGRVEDLESILIEERIPEGWESRVRRPFGLTLATFNRTVLKVELGIDEKKYREKLASTTTEADPASSKV